MSSPISGLGAIGNISVLPLSTSIAPSDAGGGFSGVLKNALQQVNQLSGGAEQQIGSLLKGGNADMSTVMIAVEKADVAFQLMMQVRNKIVSAYQDIEKMQF
jgi:flagellar hook-basal body complex protein FliE